MTSEPPIAESEGGTPESFRRRVTEIRDKLVSASDDIEALRDLVTMAFPLDEVAESDRVLSWLHAVERLIDEAAGSLTGLVENGGRRRA